MPGHPVDDWSDLALTSLTSALALFLAAVPRIVGFTLILTMGWLLARALGRATASVLRAAGFNDLAAGAGLGGLITRMGLREDACAFAGRVVRWLVRVAALLFAFDTLGLPAVSEVVESLLLWLPNLLVALAVLVLGGLAATAVGRVVRGTAASARLGNPDLLAGLARGAVWVFAVVVAVNQVGVATELVNLLFAGLVFAAALAVGLAFGLGGKEIAAEILRGWYERSDGVFQRLREAAETAAEDAYDPGPATAGPPIPRDWSGPERRRFPRH